MKQPITATTLQALADIAQECGLTQASLRTELGLEQLPSSQEGLTGPKLMQGVLLVINHAQDPDVVTRALAVPPLASLGLPGFVMRSCATLGQAYERLNSYQALLHQDRSDRLHVHSKRQLILEFLPPPSTQGTLSHQVVTMRLLMAISLGRRLSGVDWVPARVTLPEVPWNRATLETYLGCAIALQPGPGSLHIGPQTLALPLPTAQSDMLDFFENEARSRLPAEPTDQEGSTSSRLRAQLRAAEPWRTPDSEKLARALGMSRRTLYRRLAQEGTSVKEQRDALRRESAAQLLRETPHNVDTIARMVGYSDARAFRRAWKRWTGESVAAWRAAQG